MKFSMQYTNVILQKYQHNTATKMLCIVLVPSVKNPGRSTKV